MEGSSLSFPLAFMSGKAVKRAESLSLFGSSLNFDVQVCCSRDF